jgi:membrane-bound inhibitor of C-type lysozyme
MNTTKRIGGKVAICLSLGSFTLMTGLCASAGTLNVPQIDTGASFTRVYQCDAHKSLTVTYWNGLNGQSFALLPIEGKSLLFVDTLAASGVKYEAGRYTWWTKGNNGDLYDKMAGENTAPILAGCSVAPVK